MLNNNGLPVGLVRTLCPSLWQPVEILQPPVWLLWFPLARDQLHTHGVPSDCPQTSQDVCKHNGCIHELAENLAYVHLQRPIKNIGFQGGHWAYSPPLFSGLGTTKVGYAFSAVKFNHFSIVLRQRHNCCHGKVVKFNRVYRVTDFGGTQPRCPPQMSVGIFPPLITATVMPRNIFRQLYTEM